MFFGCRSKWQQYGFRSSSTPDLEAQKRSTSSVTTMSMQPRSHNSGETELHVLSKPSGLQFRQRCKDLGYHHFKMATVLTHFMRILLARGHSMVHNYHTRLPPVRNSTLDSDHRPSTMLKLEHQNLWVSRIRHCCKSSLQRCWSSLFLIVQNNLSLICVHLHPGI